MSLLGSHFYEFESYRLDTVERLLIRGNEPVPLTPKAYDTLLALVENAGHGLEKDELIRRVWPDTFVEESSLSRTIYMLRKVLGDDGRQYIETLPKHGYRFIAQVTEVAPAGESVIVDEHMLTRVVIEETETRAPHQSLRRVAAALFLLVLLAGAIAYTLTRRGAGPPVRSLAVLPLKNLAGGTEQRHLELGISDSILGKVSGISGLTVRPITAVRKYLESGVDPLAAARELHVDAILDGTLQVAGNRVRVSLNLWHASTRRSLWAKAFDVAWSDIFQVEEEIAGQVASQLRQQFDPVRQVRASQPSKNPEAYEHYLKGLFSNEAVRPTSRAAIETAIIRFRKATELDPSFGQAWAQLAICYGELLNYHQSDQTLNEAARSAASRAYALDPDLPELLLLRAQTFWSWRGRYQIEEAIRELRRGAGYNDAVMYSLLGVIYSHVGLDRQAIAQVQRAIEIDPTSSLHLDRLAQVYVGVGRYEAARAAFERAFAIESDERGNLAMSAIPFLYSRQFQEARRRLEKAARFRNPRSVMVPAHLALLAALEGKFQEAEAAIPPDTQETEKFRDVHHAFFAYAQICALQGESAEAIRWLRATVEAGMPNYPMFARDPYLSRIRNRAEFIQFMADLKPRWDAMAREFQ